MQRAETPRAVGGPGAKGGEGGSGRGVPRDLRAEGRGYGRGEPGIAARRVGDRGAVDRRSGRGGSGIRTPTAGDPGKEAALPASSGTARPPTPGPPLKADAARTPAEAHPALGSFTQKASVLHGPSRP